MSTELVRYDAMVYAIAECHRVDEVKDIRDKAMALELYAKQIRNTDAERKASEVRLRAEIRTGELLKELARGEAGRPAEIVPAAGSIKHPSPYAQALADNNISTQAASRYQALADVPKDVIEQALQDPATKPSARAIIDAARDPQHKMPADALWFWGRLRDFERDGFFSKDFASLLEPMTESMRADVVRILPLLADFLNHGIEVLHEPA